MTEFEKLEQSIGFIRQLIGGFTPDIALILGSGLGYMGDTLEDAVAIDYGDIPHFKASTAPDHKGRLVFGRLGGKNVAVMQGRIHYYEGYSYREVAYPVQVLRLLGARTLIVTNASGGIDTSFQAGELMLITDHIKFFNDSPLRGENLPELGERFPDMTFAYTPALCELARRAAREEDIVLREGVYAYFPGPQFETPAEIRALRTLGAAAVGMSTVPEVIAAAHAGMRVLGISLVCNMAAGVLNQPLSAGEVTETADRSRQMFSRFLLRCIAYI